MPSLRRPSAANDGHRNGTGLVPAVSEPPPVHPLRRGRTCLAEEISHRRDRCLPPAMRVNCWYVPVQEFAVCHSFGALRRRRGTLRSTGTCPVGVHRHRRTRCAGGVPVSERRLAGGQVLLNDCLGYATARVDVHPLCDSPGANILRGWSSGPSRGGSLFPSAGAAGLGSVTGQCRSEVVGVAVVEVDLVVDAVQGESDGLVRFGAV
jgi:hypothetical protein